MTDTTARRAALIAGLRELADFYETHPDMPLPPSASFAHCVLADSDSAGAAAVKAIAGQLGTLAEVDAGSVNTARRFGGLNFEAFYVSRQQSADWDALTSYRGSIRAEETAAGLDTPADASGEGVSSMASGDAAAAPSAVGAGEGATADGVTPTAAGSDASADGVDVARPGQLPRAARQGDGATPAPAVPVEQHDAPGTAGVTPNGDADSVERQCRELTDAADQAIARRMRGIAAGDADAVRDADQTLDIVCDALDALDEPDSSSMVRTRTGYASDMD